LNRTKNPTKPNLVASLHSLLLRRRPCLFQTFLLCVFFCPKNHILLPSHTSHIYLFATTIMAATAVVWQPRDDGLAEICSLLEQQISPSSVVDKSQIWKQLQHFSQFPDFNNYLVFILVRAEVLELFSTLSSLPEIFFLLRIDSIYLSNEFGSLNFRLLIGFSLLLSFS